MPDKLSFTESGEGEPNVVLLHGFCETKNVWNQVIPKLSKHARVFALDLPGFGESPLDHENITVEDVSDIISDWIDEQGMEKIILIGHSLGGYITLAFAERHADKLSALGLFHSTAYADSKEKKENRLKAVQFIKKNGPKLFINALIPTLFKPENRSLPIVADAIENYQNTKANSIIAYLQAMRKRTNRSYLLKNSDLPCLFITGKYDEVLDMKSLKEQMSSIKHGEGHFLNNSAHMGMLEEPMATSRILSSFIERVS